MALLQDIQQLNVGSLLTFYKLDLNPCYNIRTGDSGAGIVWRFFDGVTETGNNVIWRGEEYTRSPIASSGFDKEGSGTIPRPKLTLSNYEYIIGTEARRLNDFIGAKLTRTRTFLKYIDAVNFTGGNPNADPTMYLDKEIWIIDRKVNENKLYIEFELTAPYDVLGVQLPRRQCIQNTCTWVYKGEECGAYAGANGWFKLDDTPTANPAEDACGKRISSCKKRWGQTELPFGGFPGMGFMD